MIKVIQLPIENVRKNLRSELKSVEGINNRADGCDSISDYTEGKADGIRLALYLLSKEEKRLSKEAL